MTEGRKVRPGEVPRFGSVWFWGESTDLAYVALGLLPSEGGGALLVALDARSASIETNMIWSGWSGHVLPEWYCLDEGDMGHPGSHRGSGAPDCPREPHHHHDERCFE